MDNDIGKKLIEALKALQVASQGGATLLETTNDIISRQSKLAQLNLKVNDLMSMKVGNLTTGLGKNFGISLKLNESISTSTNKNVEFAKKVGFFARDVKIGVGELVEGFPEITDAMLTMEGASKFTADAMTSVADAVITAGRSFGSAAVRQAEASKQFVPVVTELATRMAIFDSGLENYSLQLGNYFARSELLGEDLGEVAKTVRGLTTTLALSKREQFILTKAVEDFAMTYKTTNQSLIQSMGELADTMAIANVTNNKNTTELFAKIQAMTNRLAPDALESALGPLFKSGAESIGLAAQLGIREQANALVQGTANEQDVLEIIDAFLARRDSVTMTDSYEGAVIGASIAEQLTTLNAGQLNTLEIAREAILEGMNTTREVASVNDGLSTIDGILKTMSSALEQLKLESIKFLTTLAEDLGPKNLEKIGQILVIVGAIGTVVALLGLIVLPIMSLVGFLAPIATAILTSTSFFGLVTLSLTAWLADAMGWLEDVKQWFKDILPSWIKSPIKALIEAFKSEPEKDPPAPPPNPTEVGTNEHTATTAKNTTLLADAQNDRDRFELRRKANEYAESHAKILGDLLKASTRIDSLKDEDSRQSYYESKKLNKLMETLVTEIVIQNDIIRAGKRTSAFSTGDGN